MQVQLLVPGTATGERVIVWKKLNKVGPKETQMPRPDAKVRPPYQSRFRFPRLVAPSLSLLSAASLDCLPDRSVARNAYKVHHRTTGHPLSSFCFAQHTPTTFPPPPHTTCNQLPSMTMP